MHSASFMVALKLCLDMLRPCSKSNRNMKAVLRKEPSILKALSVFPKSYICFLFLSVRFQNSFKLFSAPSRPCMFKVSFQNVA